MRRTPRKKSGTRREEGVRNSQRLVQQVLETLPVGVAVLDRDGDIILNNPASARIWGAVIRRGQERYARSIGRHHFGLATVVRDAAGRAVRVYGTNADITRRKRAEDELARRREELQALSRKLIEAQEAEQRAVARELHDDFGQVLTAIKLNLKAKERDQAETIALVDGAIVRLRDLAHALRPSMLDDLGLSESLRWYVDREARRAGLEAHLDIATIEGRLPRTIETTCFRVTQEALTNVIRHARARRIEVELRSSPDGLSLEVRDDGSGFDPAAARGDSQGLLGMRERVALAGGELEVDSAPRPRHGRARPLRSSQLVRTPMMCVNRKSTRIESSSWRRRQILGSNPT